MREYFKEVSWVREVIFASISAIIFGIIYLLALPAFFGWGFMWTLVAALAVPGLIGLFILLDGWGNKSPVIMTQIIATILLVLFMLVAWIGSGSLFNAKKHAATFVPTEVQTQKEDIPSFDAVDSVALMDTASAKKLGDRTLGSLSKYVSQFNVANDYTTISYQGRVMKIAPLVHGGFFKAMKNDTIPGYVIVDCLTNEAKFVEVEGGIKYSPSAYFSKDLLRHIRSEYTTEILGNYYNFQIDEEGNPYWVVTVLDYQVWMSAKTPVGAIIVNAVDGTMQKYALNEIPTWVEQVFDGDIVTTLYNRHGKLLNGAFNFSDSGKTQVTEDYGYLEKNGDIYIYTGVTSVAADESNIGFIMVNSRTGECKYYPVAGAEEYSAMSAAEGVVQNYGYEASFPSLVMYEDTPTYVMVLKDSNGLVKKYAMVNMVNYTIVAVEDTLNACKSAYIKAITGEDAPLPPVENDSVVEEYITTDTITIASIEFITINGTTVAYVKDTNGRFYKQSFAQNDYLILLEVGQEVVIEYNTLYDFITPVNFKIGNNQ